MKRILKSYGVYFLFLIIIVAIACLFHFTFRQEKSKPNKDVGINFNEIQTEEVKDINQLENIQLIYSQREVTGFDQEKNNKYKTGFYLTDLKGVKKYEFYSTEDLTYEQAYLFGQNKILILKEFGTTENYLVDFQGKIVKDIFIPPVNFGTDFVLSKDAKKLAYVIDNNSGKEEKEIANIDVSIKVHNQETGIETEIKNTDIKHNEIEFDSFSPLAFSKDNKFLFILARQNGNYGSPEGLYKINLESKEIKELYFSSFEESGEKDMINFLGIYPELDFALVNRGAQVTENDNIRFRTQIQKLNLETNEFIDLFKDESNNLIDNLQTILSPDGEKIILTNNPNYDEGFSVLNIINKQKTNIINRGDFVAWTPDSKSIIYLNFSLIPEEETNINQQNDQRIELHVIDAETKNDYKIYTQKSADEGTGLNKEGDLFYSYIGVISK